MAKKKSLRKREKCKKYTAKGKWFKNKIRALTKHVFKFPNDQAATEAFNRLEKIKLTTPGEIKRGNTGGRITIPRPYTKKR